MIDLIVYNCALWSRRILIIGIETIDMESIFIENCYER